MCRSGRREWMREKYDRKDDHTPEKTGRRKRFAGGGGNRFFKGKEIEEVVIDKLKEKHDITYLTEASVEPKKAAVSPKKANIVTQKKEKNKIPTKLEPAKTPEEKVRSNLNMTQLSMSRFSALRAVLNKRDLKGENGNYPKRGGSDKLFTEMLDQMYQLLDEEQKELFNTLVETEMSFK